MAENGRHVIVMASLEMAEIEMDPLEKVMARILEQMGLRADQANIGVVLERGVGPGAPRKRWWCGILDSLKIKVN